MEQLAFDSEESSSSGCESGWTLYLQHEDYSIPHDLKPSDHAQQQEDQEDDDDDDMSMVSDASSGPPHDDFQEHQEQDHEDDEYRNNEDGHVFCHPPLMSTPRKRRKILNQTSFHSHRHLQDHFPDHDTASSPFFTTKDLKVCNKEDDNSSDYSQGHSTTYFEMV